MNFELLMIRVRVWLKIKPFVLLVGGLWLLSGTLACAHDYYVDARVGSDAAAGTSPQAAWRSLSRASRLRLEPGDRLLLKRGDRFPGMLVLTCKGSAGHPVVIGAYGEGAERAVIDAAGMRAGIRLEDVSHVTVQGLEITGDGAKGPRGAGAPHTSGVLIENTGAGSSSEIRLIDLHIHDIFATKELPDEGARRLSNQGIGIEILNSNHGGTLGGILIAHCAIERTGRTGISLGGGNFRVPASYVHDVAIVDNELTDIGGPGINPRVCRNVLVRGNTVDRSGSSVDPRMHGRGSGIWPWHCDVVLIEYNRFMNARGPGDSCGMHIDFGCRDVVAQYNLSMNNEGGFVEILGDNDDCAYRYNVSVNDGSRVKGRNGAFQEGKILWFSGYGGRYQPKKGPYHCYIYNNTIYVGPGGRSCFSVGSTARGVVIANNLFVLLGKTLTVRGDQERRLGIVVSRIPDSIVTHNLYVNRHVLPSDWPLQDEAPVYGDPRFARPGGADIRDYIPGDGALIHGRGIVVQPVMDDHGPLAAHLTVTHDILGNPVTGVPDLGAIQLPTSKP